MNETLLSQKPNIIETPQIKIEKNSFIYEDSVLQISNISFVTAAPVTEKPVRLWAILLAIVGFLLLFKSFIWGLFLFAIGALYIAETIIYNSTKGYYLRIDMNSGAKYYFSGKNMSFLEEVKDVMIECMNNENCYYKIDMGHAEIQMLQIGNQNEMTRQ